MLQKAYLQGIDGARKRVEFMFNPTQYSVSRKINYERVKSKGKNVPRLEFVSGQGRTLNFEIIVDTYEEGESVTDFVKDLEVLANVDTRTEGNAKKPRPQLVQFGWGTESLFRSLVRSLDVTYTLFHSDGAPARAKIKMSLEEVPDDLPGQNPTSLGGSGFRRHVVLPGETIDVIAYEELGDSQLWPKLAELNDLDDPMGLQAGDVLAISTELNFA